MKKCFKWISLSSIGLCIASVLFLFLIPIGYKLRVLIAESLLSSQHGYLAKFTFLSESTLLNIEEQIFHPIYENVNSVAVRSLSHAVSKSENGHLDVQVISLKKTYSGTYYYTGKLLIVSDPKDVHLVASNNPHLGQQINVLARNAHAIAATNAGGFLDINGEGNGGMPEGIVIVNGQILHTPPGGNNAKTYVGAITNDGVLVTGYYSAKELENMQVKYAVGFRPQLISNGHKLITNGDGGWGIGPRTAIGQTKDGKILLLVIDGRQAHSLGATIREVQNILYQYGAVNAISMDGGSSSSMWLNGQNVTVPSSVGHIPRWLPNAWVVVPSTRQIVAVTENGQLRKH